MFGVLKVFAVMGVNNVIRLKINAMSMNTLFDNRQKVGFDMLLTVVMHCCLISSGLPLEFKYIVANCQGEKGERFSIPDVFSD